LCDFLQLCELYARVICTKGEREKMRKHVSTIELKILELLFFMKFFCHEFPMFRHVHSFFSFIVVFTHLRCYTISDFHLITCVLCEKKQLKKSVDQKEKIYDFPQCSSYFILFLLKKSNTSRIILTHLYFYKHILNDMYLSKERKKLNI
jgi:hypothetical protein